MNKVRCSTATKENYSVLGEDNVYQHGKITADSGFHTELSAEYLYTHHVEIYVADNRMRGLSRLRTRVSSIVAQKS